MDTTYINPYMETLLISDLIKIKIIRALKGGKEYTLNSLRNEIGAVNFESVKRSCIFLEKLGILELDVKNQKKNKYIFVKLTDLGDKIASTI